MVTHKPGYFVLIAATWLAFLATLFLNFLGGWGAELLQWGVFQNNTGVISEAFYVEITPAGWTFGIWAVIYLWQLLWLIYALTTVCRKSDQGYLYYQPAFMPWSLYLFYMINLGGNVAWLFLWDRGLAHIALAALLAVALTLYICMGISIRAVYRHHLDLIRCGYPNEARLAVGFIHNGLGLYAGWATAAAHINFAVVLAYWTPMTQQVACSIALGTLAFVLALYLMIDLVLCEKYTRFLLTPYAALIVALIGSLLRNWRVDSANSIFTVALLCIIGVGFLIKIGVIIVRQRTRPVFVDDRKPLE